MPRPHARSFLALLGVPLLLGLCACADTMTSEDSPPTSRQLQRDYDKTLTKAEQEAVISDLQSATNKKKQGEATAKSGASTGAESTADTN
jgi:uncharacterized membrane protein YgcG